jgi:RimJ/RimL family protein N-acetyltransferase
MREEGSTMEFDQSHSFWQGERIRLRPHRPEDWEAKYQEYLDSETRAILEAGVELPKTAEEYKAAFIEDCQAEPEKDGMLTFAIETLDGEFVGWINMHARSARHGTFSCGMAIFRPYRQRGYGEEAFRIMLRYGFHELRYQKCNIECLADNEGSLRMQARIGFVPEGRRRSSAYLNGRYHDECLTGLTRDEFIANDQQYLARVAADRESAARA